MLKVSDPGAHFINGLLKINDSKYIFHMVHSDSIAKLAESTDPIKTPVPLLFSKFGIGSSPSDTTLPLFNPTNPHVSFLRLLISTRPHSPNSHLEVGFVKNNGVLILHKEPIIKISDQMNNCQLKVATTLMSATREDLSDASTLTNFNDADTMTFVSDYKQVRINENKNSITNFFEEDPPCLTQSHVSQKTGNRSPVMASDGRKTTSILKHKVLDTGSVSAEDTKVQAKTFYALGRKKPVIGECPAVAFTTITIMAKSQNSLIFLPYEPLNEFQHLFLKHVLLKRLQLDNALEHFNEIYKHITEEVSTEELQQFECYVNRMRERVEDLVFILTSIVRHKFNCRVKGKPKHNTRKALEKFFFIFHPADLDNAVTFASSIADLLCNGASFTKLITYMGTLMPIQHCESDTLLKMYTLLTS